MENELFTDEVNEQWEFKDFVEGEASEFLKLKRKVNATVSKIHGDYTKTTDLKINQNSIGQALTMFRRWIPEGVNQRFGDLQFEDDFQRHREGRYKTMFKSISNFKKQLKLLVTLNQGYVDTTGLMDHEVANLKKNAAEMQMYLALLGTALLVKISFDDEEDKHMSNFVLNQIFRLSSDLTFYSSPSSAENILRNAVPMFSMANDVAKTIEYGNKVLFDDDVNKHTTEAFWFRSAKLFPVSSSVASTIKSSQRVFD